MIICNFRILRNYSLMKNSLMINAAVVGVRTVPLFRAVLLFSFFCLNPVFSPAVFAQSGYLISESATQFLATLNAEEVKKTTYTFNDSLRFKWTNLPVGMVPRPGIQYGALSDKSRMAFHRVLSALLSSQGYLKTTSIMQLDDILNTLYQQAFDKGEVNEKTFKMIKGLNWAHGNYYISIWGTPGRHRTLGNQFWWSSHGIKRYVPRTVGRNVALFYRYRPFGSKIFQIRGFAHIEQRRRLRIYAHQCPD